MVRKFIELLTVLITACLGGISCGTQKTVDKDTDSECRDSAGMRLVTLRDSLKILTDSVPGHVGIALLTSCGDTLVINDEPDYALMSVFKLHESLAVADALKDCSAGIDTLLRISREDLDENTWSPMLKDYPEGDLSLSARDLIGYMLLCSDNNASNILFQRVVGTSQTDAFIRKLSVNGNFQIKWTEADMHKQHSRSYENCSSPLACAELMYKVFNDSLVDTESQSFIREKMEESPLTNDRLCAPFENTSVRCAHRSGSGYMTPQGVLMACNDVAYIMLPDGFSYALAVLIRDYKGTQEAASLLMARISGMVYEAVRFEQ